MDDISLVVCVTVVTVLAVVVAVTEQDGCEEATTCLTDVINSTENELHAFESKSDEEKASFCDLSRRGGHPIMMPILKCAFLIGGKCEDEATRSALEKEYYAATERFIWGIIRLCRPDAWYSSSDDPCTASRLCLQNATHFVKDMLQLPNIKLCGPATNYGHDITKAIINCTMPMDYCVNHTEQRDLMADANDSVKAFSIAIAVRCVPGADSNLAIVGPCLATKYCIGKMTADIEPFTELTGEEKTRACYEFHTSNSHVYNLTKCSAVMPYCQDQDQLNQLQLDFKVLKQRLKIAVSMTCTRLQCAIQCELTLYACLASYHTELLQPAPKSSFKFGEMSGSQDEYCRRMNNHTANDISEQIEQCFSGMFEWCKWELAETIDVKALAVDQAQHAICTDHCRNFGHKLNAAVECIPKYIVDIDSGPGTQRPSDNTITNICRALSENATLTRCFERASNCCSAIKGKLEEALTIFVYVFPAVSEACPLITRMLDGFCQGEHDPEKQQQQQRDLGLIGARSYDDDYDDYEHHYHFRSGASKMTASILFPTLMILASIKYS